MLLSPSRCLIDPRTLPSPPYSIILCLPYVSEMEGFSRFPNLPLEIQDLIWDSAVPVLLPTAYHVAMRFEDGGVWVRGQTRPPQRRDKIYLDLVQPPDTDRDQTRAELTSLLLTCRRSAAAVLRASESPRSLKLFGLRCGATTPEGGPRLDVSMDAELDLAILQPGWQGPCRLFCSRPVARLAWPTPSLRNLAIQWEGPSSKGPLYNFNALNGLLGMWMERRNLYVVVEPGHLAAAEKPWRPAEDRSWESPPGYGGQELSPEGYLAAYESEDRNGTRPYPAPTFRSGGREYFEVPAEQIARSGGLEDAVELLEIARVWCLPDEEDEEMAATRCRIMSWREL